MTPTTAPPVTSRLAAFIAGAEVPEAARRAARRALATVVPLAAGAVGQVPARHVLTVARSLDAPGPAAVLGDVDRLSPQLAALVNGTAANVDDFDDTDVQTSAHPSAAVVPAALALAEWRDRDLTELIDAVAIGIEVGTRVARALGPGHVERGWHVSSTSGQVAAAAAAAAAAGLGTGQVEFVLGIAATQVAGLGSALGTMVKPLHFGKAASNGVEAALLVDAGLTAPRTGLEGRRGLFAVVAPDADAGSVLEDLGERWLAIEVMPKPYPCGYVAHPVIDAAIDLAAELTPDDEVASIEAHVHPDVVEFMDRPRVLTVLEAKLSAQYCVSVGLTRGRLGLADFEEAALDDPALAALAARVVLVAEDRPRGTARLVARVARGDLEVDVAHARGTPQRPLDDDAVAAKGRESASRTLGDHRAADLVEACLVGDGASTARQLTALAQPAR